MSSHFFIRNFMQDFQLISGEHSGPRVAIIGAMHGNERTGVEIVQRLKGEFPEDTLNGQLLLIIGNPNAYEQDTRFVEEDLNRLFSEKEERVICEMKAEILATLERKRAKKLMEVLRGVDVLIDIHATIRPSVPFVYCEATPRHLEIAECFDVPYIVSPEPDFRPPDLFSSADNFVDRHGGIGVTYESGWHKHSKDADQIFVDLIHVLEHVGIIPSSHEVVSRKELQKAPHQLRIYRDIFSQTDHFSFLDAEIANFHFVKKGEVFAMDEDKPISAPRDSYVIFPKRDLVKGGVACYLAYQHESIMAKKRIEIR